MDLTNFIPFEVIIEGENRTVYSMIDKTEIIHLDWTAPITQHGIKYKFLWINNRVPWAFQGLVRASPDTIVYDWWYNLTKIVTKVKRIES